MVQQSYSPVQGTTVVAHTSNNPTSSASGSEQTNTNDSQTDTTPNSINSNTQLTTKQTNDNNMKQNITWYVKETSFRRMKLPPPEPAVVQSMIVRIVKLGNNNEVPKTMNVHALKWTGIFCKAITTCMHGAQTLLVARKKYNDNKRNNQTPDNFPTTVLITDTRSVNSENRYQLQEDY
eukprot:jgi/Psemu1/5720/gm1.5720_g